ncbi:hypothetical protein [Ensifer sp. YR511]|uniref:hypothetical protein n=1 Tax=Ensifer sp. YR511 TaxID=1855294 RepID=UPI00088B8699|nr:hypothetical protein [Ensifer sp. YR511]SDN84685.1 hypothetical protein SAMN05216328_13941 [Ensifer sp. YR511]
MSEGEQVIEDDPEAEGRRLFLEELQRMNERGHSTTALVAASALENFLEKAIKARMPHLNNELAGKLFDGYGPFATFSAKIDTAYAMAIIDRSVFKDIHVVREIRNVFAHPDGAAIVTFAHPKLDRIFSKWQDYRPNIDKPMFLQVKFKDILERMKPAINSGVQARPGIVE